MTLGDLIIKIGADPQAFAQLQSMLQDGKAGLESFSEMVAGVGPGIAESFAQGSGAVEEMASALEGLGGSGAAAALEQVSGSIGQLDQMAEGAGTSMTQLATSADDAGAMLSQAFADAVEQSGLAGIALSNFKALLDADAAAGVDLQQSLADIGAAAAPLGADVAAAANIMLASLTAAEAKAVQVAEAIAAVAAAEEASAAAAAAAAATEGAAFADAAAAAERFALAASTGSQGVLEFGEAATTANAGIFGLGEQLSLLDANLPGLAIGLEAAGGAATAATPPMFQFGEAATAIVAAQAKLDAEAIIAVQTFHELAAAYSAGAISADAYRAAQTNMVTSIEAAKTEAVGAQGAFGGMTSSIIATTAAFAAFSVFKSLITDSLEAAAAIEKATVSLTNMTGSASGAADQIAKLRDLANSDALAFPQLLAANQKMTAFGISAGQIPGLLNAAANTAAATGNSFDAVTSSIERIALSGTVSARSLVQLGLTSQQLAASMGVDAANVKKAFAALDESDRIDAIVTALGKYQGAASALADTLGGKFQQLQNTTEQSFEKVGTAIEPAASALISIANVAIPAAASGFSQLATAVIAPTDGLVRLIGILGQADPALTTLVSLLQQGSKAASDAGFSFMNILVPGSSAVAQALAIMDKTTKDVSASAADLASMSTSLNAKLLQLKQTSDQLGPSMKSAFDFSVSLAGFADFDPAVAKFSGSVDVLRKNLADAEDVMRKVDASIEDGIPFMGKAKAGADDYALAVKNLQAATDALYPSTNQVSTAQQTLETKLKAAQASAALAQIEFDKIAAAFENGEGSLTLYIAAFDNWVSKSKAAGQAATDTAAQIAKLGEAYDNEQIQIKGAVDVLAQLEKANDGSARASQLAQDALNQLNTLLGKLGVQATDTASGLVFTVTANNKLGDAAQAAADQLQKLYGATLTVVDVNGKMVQTTQSAADAANTYAQKLKAAADAAGNVVGVNGQLVTTTKAGSDAVQAAAPFHLALAQAHGKVATAATAAAAATNAVRDANTGLTAPTDAATVAIGGMADKATTAQTLIDRLKNTVTYAAESVSQYDDAGNKVVDDGDAFIDEVNKEQAAMYGAAQSAAEASANIDKVAASASNATGSVGKLATALKNASDAFDAPIGFGGDSGVNSGSATSYGFNYIAAAFDPAVSGFVQGGTGVADSSAAAYAKTNNANVTTGDATYDYSGDNFASYLNQGHTWAQAMQQFFPVLYAAQQAQTANTTAVVASTTAQAAAITQLGTLAAGTVDASSALAQIQAAFKTASTALVGSSTAVAKDMEDLDLSNVDLSSMPDFVAQLQAAGADLSNLSDVSVDFSKLSSSIFNTSNVQLQQALANAQKETVLTQAAAGTGTALQGLTLVTSGAAVAIGALSDSTSTLAQAQATAATSQTAVSTAATGAANAIAALFGGAPSSTNTPGADPYSIGSSNGLVGNLFQYVDPNPQLLGTNPGSTQQWTSAPVAAGGGQPININVPISTQPGLVQMTNAQLQDVVDLILTQMKRGVVIAGLRPN